MILYLFPAGIRGKGVHRLCQEGALPRPVGPLNYPRPTTKT